MIPRKIDVKAYRRPWWLGVFSRGHLHASQEISSANFQWQQKAPRGEKLAMMQMENSIHSRTTQCVGVWVISNLCLFLHIISYHHISKKPAKCWDSCTSGRITSFISRYWIQLILEIDFAWNFWPPEISQPIELAFFSNINIDVAAWCWRMRFMVHIRIHITKTQNSSVFDRNRCGCLKMVGQCPDYGLAFFR